MADKTSLFSIACDTCSARLTVRNESAIGQVLACPRCGSMVMVQPPEGWVAPTAEPLPELPRRPRDPADSQATISTEFDNLGPTALPSSSTRHPVRPASQPASPRVQANGGGPILPDGQWDSDGVRQRRKRALWIAGISGVCLISVVAILWLLVSMLGGPGNSRVAESELPPVVADPAPEATGGGSDNGSTPNDDVGNAAENADGNARPENAADRGDSGQAAESLNDNAGKAPDDTGASRGGETERDNSESDGEPPFDIDAALKPSLSGEPLAFDKNDPEKTLIEDVGPLQDLFTDPEVGIAVDEVGESRQDTLVGLGKVFVPRPRPMELDFESQLKEVYPGVNFEEVPLIEFVRTMNVLTRIPIQLDSGSVTYGHIDPMQKITCTVTDKALTDILDAACNGLGLVAIADPENEVIVVTHRDNNLFAERKLTLDEVLRGDEARGQQLVSLIETVTGPELWNSGDGQSRLAIAGADVVVESTGVVFDEVKWLLDHLAAAVRLKADPDDTVSRAVLCSVWMASAAVLESNCLWEEIQLLPAEQVMTEVARHESLVALWDWRSLRGEGWTPDTQMPWPGGDATVEDALTDVTGSMGLAWRLLAVNTVEITARDPYRNRTRYEVYPCGPVVKRLKIEQVMGILQARLYSDLQRSEAWTRVDYFPDGDCIVARLPDPLHIRLEKLLQELAR